MAHGRGAACLRRARSHGREHIPRVKLFKVNKPDFDFLAFDEAERLIAATDSDSRAAVLVAVKAGLRLGEILALQWSDLDLVKGRVVVRRNIWRGHLNETPKGGRTRSVDLPGSVIGALKAHRHLRGPWVFCNAKGQPLTDKQLDQAAPGDAGAHAGHKEAVVPISVGTTAV